MVSGEDSRANGAVNTGEASDIYCPHLVFDGVLGDETIRRLLEHVDARQAAFKPAKVRNRASGQREIDSAVRDCLTLMDVGPFGAAMADFVNRVAGQAVSQFRMSETIDAPRGFEIASYGDGCRFAPHIDTEEKLENIRVISGVYYFANTPRHFSGGELRLYRLPTLSGGPTGQSRIHTDVIPQTDRLVLFPSWIRHEVLPVRVASGAWEDNRFTINFWLHRAGKPQ